MVKYRTLCNQKSNLILAMYSVLSLDQIQYGSFQQDLGCAKAKISGAGALNSY